MGEPAPCGPSSIMSEGSDFESLGEADRRQKTPCSSYVGHHCKGTVSPVRRGLFLVLLDRPLKVLLSHRVFDFLSCVTIV